jgi:FkbM family methyltransferase
MECGRGESCRSPRWPERAAAACGRALGNSRLRGAARRVWETLLDRWPGDALVSTLPGGERVRLAAAHRHLTWNALEYDAFRRDVRRGDTVLDVGANLGAYTLLFGQWVGVSGRVHAFEPAPDAREGLRRHVRLNGLEPCVSVWPEAMGRAEGSAAFVAEGSRGDNRLSGLEAAPPTACQIGVTSVDAFCRRVECRPTLIKVDVEGAELDVLRGARATIAALGPALALYVEMHPHLWPCFGASREALEAELATQRLSAERLDGKPGLWDVEGICLRLRRCAS